MTLNVEQRNLLEKDLDALIAASIAVGARREKSAYQLKEDMKIIQELRQHVIGWATYNR